MSLTVERQRELTPKRLEPQQILKAAAALSRHLEKQRDETKIEKPSLLADDDEENKNSKLDVPLWLLLTAKQHLATSHSLQPGKVIVPHAIYSSPQTQICLISADPPKDDEKAYKNLIQDKAFPKDLAGKIKKVIAFTKLSKKYKSYESRRQLLAEYDLFLVDQRVARLLPAALGKTFYQSATKRPIPVSLVGKETVGKKQKKTALERLKPKNKSAPTVIGQPADVGTDIEKALATVAIHLSPSPTLSIKVAYAGWPAEWIADNVAAVVERAVTRYVPGKYAGLKSLYLKGPKTAALPIWMADELWQDEAAVLNQDQQESGINLKRLTKEERQKRKDAIEEKKSKRAKAPAIADTDGKKRKRATAEEEPVLPKKSKVTGVTPTTDQAQIQKTITKPKEKRKHNAESENDEEFEAAQQLHQKLKAKKVKTAAVAATGTEPEVSEPTTKTSRTKGKAKVVEAEPEQVDKAPAVEATDISAKKKGKKAVTAETAPTRARSTRNKIKT